MGSGRNRFDRKSKGGPRVGHARKGTVMGGHKKLARLKCKSQVASVSSSSEGREANSKKRGGGMVKKVDSSLLNDRDHDLEPVVNVEWHYCEGRGAFLRWPHRGQRLKSQSNLGNARARGNC